jgi:predicted MFS family arabinose efflux permease
MHSPGGHLVMPTTAPPRTPATTTHRLPHDFAVFWFGDAVSLVGTSTTSVLLPLLAVVHLHAGPAWMGAITAAAWLPWLAIGLPAGAWVDRLPPRGVMLTANLVSAGALASVPISWWLGRLQLTQLLVVALVVGCATVFFKTAYVKLVPLLVASDQLEAANARLFGSESAAQVAGPGVAGALTALISAATGVLLDVVSFLVSALCLFRIRPARPERAPLTGRASLASQIREGIALVFRDRNLWPFSVIGGATNFGLIGYSAVLVVYLVDRLGLSATAVSLLLMTASVGGVLGAALARRLARRIGNGRASTTLLLVSGASGLLIGLPADRDESYVVAVGQLVLSAAVVGGNVLRGAWRQRYVPAQVMGRVAATSQLINFGTMPIAALVAGVLATQVGTRTTILVMTAVNALACLSILATRIGRTREFPLSPG